jgi:predicted GIY-YIG superfamily endonuclease
MGALPFPAGVVAVAGSRSLPLEASAVVAAVARELVAGGCSLVVGCCVGADAAVLAALAGAGGAAAGAPFRVLCAWGPGGAGAGPTSAMGTVLAAAGAGVPVVWWSGDGPDVPLRARLAARTRAVVAEASAGCVVFFDSPASRGSLLAAQVAVERSLPVVAFPVGFAPAQLPELGAGVWVPVGLGGVWIGAWRWSPAPGLFDL